MIIHCPSCNRAYDLTADYLAEYGGAAMDCSCGQEMAIPQSNVPVAVAVPAQLSYSAPQFPMPKAEQGAWRDGPFLVLSKGTHLPARCCVCNAPAEGVVKTTLKWVPPKHRGGGLVGAIMADVHTQFIVVEVARCPVHSKPFRPGRTGWMVFAIGIIGILVSVIINELNRTVGKVGACVSISMIFIGVIITAIPSRIRVADFRENCAWIRGFCKDYLDALPDLNESYQKESEILSDAIDQTKV